MTGSATTLLATLVARGIELRPVGDRIRFWPMANVTQDLRGDLARHKADLLVLLHRLDDPALPRGIWASCASALLAQIRDASMRADLREEFEERAGICEFDGNLSVDDAERIAFVQLCRAVRATTHGKGVLPQGSGQ